MKIKEVLKNKNYEHLIKKIPIKIQNFEAGNCTEVKPIPNTISKLFNGLILYNNTDDNKEITLNLEYFDSDEFLPMSVAYTGTDGYISVTIDYDENLNAFVNDLR